MNLSLLIQFVRLPATCSCGVDPWRRRWSYVLQQNHHSFEKTAFLSPILKVGTAPIVKSRMPAWLCQIQGSFLVFHSLVRAHFFGDSGAGISAAAAFVRSSAFTRFRSPPSPQPPGALASCRRPIWSLMPFGVQGSCKNKFVDSGAGILPAGRHEQREHTRAGKLTKSLLVCGGEWARRIWAVVIFRSPRSVGCKKYDSE